MFLGGTKGNFRKKWAIFLSSNILFLCINNLNPSVSLSYQFQVACCDSDSCNNDIKNYLQKTKEPEKEEKNGKYKARFSLLRTCLVINSSRRRYKPFLKSHLSFLLQFHFSLCLDN